MYNSSISINDLLNPVAQPDTTTEQSSTDKKRKMHESVESMSAPPQSQVIVTSQQLNLASTSTPSLNTSMIPVNPSYGTGFQPITPDRQASKVAKHMVVQPTPTGIVGQPKFTPASIFNAFLNPSQPPMVIQQPNPHTDKRKVNERVSVSTAPLQPQRVVTPVNVSRSLPVKEIEINGRHRFSNALMSFSTEAQQAFQHQAKQFFSQVQQPEITTSRQSKTTRSTRDDIPDVRARIREPRISNPQVISTTSVSMPPVYETTTSHIVVPADAEQPVHHPLIIQQPIVTQTRNTMPPTVILTPDEYYYPCEPLEIPDKKLKIFSETMPGGHEKYFVKYPLENGEFKNLPVFKGKYYHMNKLLLPTNKVISFKELLTLETTQEKRKLIHTISGVEGQPVQVYTRNQLVKIKKEGKYFYPTNPPKEVESDVAVLEEKDGKLINYYVEYRASDQALPIKIPVYDANKSHDNRLMFSLEEGVTLAHLQTLVIEASAEGKKYFVTNDGQKQEVFKHYTLRKDSMLTYQKNAREHKKETRASVVLSSIFNQSQAPTQTAETSVQTMTPTQK